MWSDVEFSKFSAYISSKIAGEKAAWDYQKTCQQADKYCPELATILPGQICGEAIGGGPDTTPALFVKMMNGEHKGNI